MPPKRASARRGSVTRQRGPTESPIGLRQSRERSVASQEHANESRMTTRSQRRLGSTSISPVRSPSKRHGTPDERQVLESLREASAGVSHSQSMERHAATIETGPSTATPSPPIQHTISTTSTPAPPTFDHSVANGDSPDEHRSASFMYPPLSRFGSQTNRGSSVLSSPQHADSFDNESTVSWVLERDLHGDEVQRIRPNRYRRQEPHGRNITAPPRRLSGLTFLNDTIHEQPDSPSPPVSSAPAKTVISTTTVRDIPDHDSTIDEASVAESTTFAASDYFALFMAGLRRIRFHWSLIFTALVAASAFGIYCFSDQMAAATHALTSSLPFGHKPPYATLNASDVRIIASLSNEVERLGSRLSSMSNEVDVLKSDWREGAEQPTPVRPVEPQGIDRINFLSLGMGTAVDLSLTSPSIGRRRTLVRRLYGYVTGHQHRHPNPPDTALKPWDGVGDCWCSAPSNAGLAQIAILLGQRAVPEEVVVEHIPKQASPNPDVAPREMELWVQFKPHQDPAALGSMSSESSVPPPPASSGSSFFDRFFSPSKPSPDYSSPPSAATPSSPLSLSSLYDAILETLHRAYPSEPEAAYSTDALLGPSFFRVGKWQYDRDGDVAQRFKLDAIVDLPTLRVDKVVFRVKSNWGAPHTCLYRLKLYGHV